MKLSILIATQGRRDKVFRKLLDKLLDQISQFDGQVEIVAYWNNGELSIGEIRQALLESAKGDYICFVDDDDSVPHYYIEEIMKSLGKDYIGFKVKLFNNGEIGRTSYHDIQYSVWSEDEHGFYRGVTHLNPTKRKIALKGRFDGNAGEDSRWATQVTPFVKSQTYIDRFMYYYYHDRKDSSFGGEPYIDPNGYKRPDLKQKNFRYHPDSKLTSKENE